MQGGPYMPMHWSGLQLTPQFMLTESETAFLQLSFCN